MLDIDNNGIMENFHKMAQLMHSPGGWFCYVRNIVDPELPDTWDSTKKGFMSMATDMPNTNREVAYFLYCAL